MKFDAVSFSWAGDKYLGTSYDVMDCQAFVERCMRDVGLHMDLGGSNSWFREIMKNGWTGTPEECVKLFGSVPKGALLFIWEPVSDSTPGKFRSDGIGDLTHIGIKTGRGDGAIHSSHSRGCVCNSKFKDKTIPNGGWNRVGLYNKFDYGKSVNWYLEHNSDGEPPEEKEDVVPMQGVVYSENGKPVKLRQKPSTSCNVYWEIPNGSQLTIMETGTSWSKCTTGGLTGWMMNQFIRTDEAPPETDPDPQEDFNPGDLVPDPDTLVTIRLDAGQVAALVPVLHSIIQQITEPAGRG